MPATSSDPTVIRSIAVTTADVVAALELNRTSDERAVLRITPPFSGRMRARLHVVQDADTTPNDRTVETNRRDAAAVDVRTQPLHVDPDQLVKEPPAYPRPADTEDDLRADPECSYTVDRHHEYHAAAVEQWREAIPETIREHATLETPRGPHEVTVKRLQGELV